MVLRLHHRFAAPICTLVRLLYLLLVLDVGSGLPTPVLLGDLLVCNQRGGG